MRRFLALLAVLALGAVGIVAAASGAPNPNKDSTFAGSAPIEAVVSASTCSETAIDITLTGTVQFMFHLSFNAQGAGQFSISQAIHGTGVGTDGSTYSFNYHQTLSGPFTADPLTLSVVDHFNLVGNGGANRIHTFFTGTFTFVGDQVVDFNIDHAIGDPEHCDPL